MTPNHSTNWLEAHGDASPVIDPRERMLRMAAQAGIADDPPLPPLALCAFMERTVEEMVLATKAEPCPFHSSSAIGEIDGRPVVISRLQAGASAAILGFEELSGGGVQTFLVGGAVGSLVPRVVIGDFVVPIGARREEGTSLHYVSPNHEPRARGAASRALVEAARKGSHNMHVGCVWSTDAPYREFAGKVRAYGEEGVLGVEMEAAALMSVAEFRGVDVGLLLTVSDHVFDSGWANILGSAEFDANCADLAEVLFSSAKCLLEQTDEDGS